MASNNHGVAANTSAFSTDSAAQGSWAAQASQLASTGIQPRKALPVRVRGKSTHTTVNVKAVPRYLTCFVGRISPDVTEDDLAGMLEDKGIVGVRCKKIEPKNGRTYSTAAFRVSCSVSYESIFSERELTQVHVRYLSSTVRLSSVVCDVGAPYSGD